MRFTHSLPLMNMSMQQKKFLTSVLTNAEWTKLATMDENMEVRSSVALT